MKHSVRLRLPDRRHSCRRIAFAGPWPRPARPVSPTIAVHPVVLADPTPPQQRGRLAQQAGGGRAPGNPPSWRCHRKCPPRRSPKSSARGGNRRWTPRSKKPAVFRGRGKRAKRRRMEGRHRPDAANPGGRAVSLDRDAIAEGSSRRRARRSLAADIAISGLTPSDRSPGPEPVADASVARQPLSVPV